MGIVGLRCDFRTPLCSRSPDSVSSALLDPIDADGYFPNPHTGGDP